MEVPYAVFIMGWMECHMDYRNENHVCMQHDRREAFLGTHLRMSLLLFCSVRDAETQAPVHHLYGVPDCEPGVQLPLCRNLLLYYEHPAVGGYHADQKERGISPKKGGVYTPWIFLSKNNKKWFKRIQLNKYIQKIAVENCRSWGDENAWHQ